MEVKSKYDPSYAKQELERQSQLESLSAQLQLAHVEKTMPRSMGMACKQLKQGNIRIA